MGAGMFTAAKPILRMGSVNMDARGKNETLFETGGGTYYREEPNGFVYKMHTDGTGRIRLNTHDSACINVPDDFVYYSNLSDGERIYNIYKMNTDGSGKIRLDSRGGNCINIAGGRIYYRADISETPGIWKIRTGGTREQVME
jgi:hypothetical protein